MKNETVQFTIVIIIVAILCLGAGFFAGRASHKATIRELREIITSAEDQNKLIEARLTESEGSNDRITSAVTSGSERIGTAINIFSTSEGSVDDIIKLVESIITEFTNLKNAIYPD